MNPELLAILALVLGAEFINGYTDAPNATATAVATGLLTRRKALWWAAASNLIGLLPSLVFGAAVANTIGKGIVQPSAVNVDLIAAAMCAVVLWGRIASLIGLPVSKSHALLAALAGAGYMGAGRDALVASGWIKVAQGIGISIVVASSLSWILGRMLLWLQADRTVSDTTWRRLQLITLTLVAGMHGWNDGLKFVGVFALVLFLGGITKEFTVTPGIILLCAFVMGAGTLCGGWRIVARIKKMAHNDCTPWQGVVAESISAVCIGISAFGGVPMSTTHTVVSAIGGVRSSVGVKGLHWNTTFLIVWGWFLTIVLCSLGAALFTVIGWKIILTLLILGELTIQYLEHQGRTSLPETGVALEF